MNDGKATRISLRQAMTACLALGPAAVLAQESPTGPSVPEQSLGVVKAVDDNSDTNTTQIGKVPQTLLRLTPSGTEAFEKYRRQLKGAL